jgi:hypothetical protein
VIAGGGSPVWARQTFVNSCIEEMLPSAVVLRNSSLMTIDTSSRDKRPSLSLSYYSCYHRGQEERIDGGKRQKGASRRGTSSTL